VPVSVRLDPQVLNWLRGKGEGHLTRINDILINLTEAGRRAGACQDRLYFAICIQECDCTGHAAVLIP